MASFTTWEPRPICAHISTFHESDHTIETQLRLADRAQRALKLQSPEHGAALSHTNRHLLHRVHAAVRRKTCKLTHLSGQRHESASEVLPHNPFKRSYSFNSVSTYQRQLDAADLTSWRPSPVTAPSSSPTFDRSSYLDEKKDFQDPCPPLRVYTKKEARKDAKRKIKEEKASEKQRKKQMEHEAKLKREVLAAQVAEARRIIEAQTSEKLAQLHVQGLTSNSPRSSKSVRNVVRKLASKRPLNKLTTKSRKIKTDELGNTDQADVEASASQSAAEQYVPPLAAQEPAELPAELPAYTPEKYLRPPPAKPQPSGPIHAFAPQPSPVDDISSRLGGVSLNRGHGSCSKPMLCDSCYSGISLSQSYYRCGVCENGDRIYCFPCTDAGRCCRHELCPTSRFSGQNPSTHSLTTTPVLPSLCLPNLDISNQEKYPPWSYSGLPESQTADRKPTTAQADMGDSHLRRSEHNRVLAGGTAVDSQNVQRKLQQQLQQQLELLRKLQFQNHDQDITVRERELALKEREAALRRHEIVLCEREALSSRSEAPPAPSLNLTISTHDKNLGIGSQFLSCHDCASHKGLGVSRSSSIELSSQTGAQAGDRLLQLAVAKVLENSVPRILLSDPRARSCTTKRKANSRGSGSFHSLHSGEKPGQGSSRRQSSKCRDTDGGDDEERDGSPKRQKQDSPELALPQKLLACPYHKYDPVRYSERNGAEKPYRGCASGYWTDMSRLKYVFVLMINLLYADCF